ncbi:MAG: hypothetical protein RBS68_12565 [Anaerolineales bacterium]|nr:hypothetical protein [Anaerolineales bacterium]
MDNLSGAIERITFYNPENGYTVLRLRPEVSRGQRIPGLSYDGLTTVVSNLPELSPGEHVRLQGLWDTHPNRSSRPTT